MARVLERAKEISGIAGYGKLQEVAGDWHEGAFGNSLSR
jgi:hypothetical protein